MVIEPLVRHIPILLLISWVWGMVACSSDPPPECTSDTDCPAGRYCRNEQCTFDCTFNADCPDGFRCTGRGRCERGCVPTNNGVEACDEQDNDCDDETDEDFPGLGQACTNGACQGSWVCSADQTAQECNAPLPADDDATCDGLDQDCDGLTDEDAQAQNCPLQQGICAGATFECLDTGEWSTCDYGADYTEGVDQICDQLDSDCDGQTDEEATPLLQAEDGAWAGDGLDNNCNGIADEPGGLMIRLAPPAEGWIDAYEITVWDNPDCSGNRYGEAGDDYPAAWPPVLDETVDLYACSIGGVIPSAWLTWYRAKRACEAQGKMLCSMGAIGQACSAGTLQLYPYGPVWAADVCNDAITGMGQAAPTGSYTECTVGNGTFDMSGNLGEWIVDLDPEYGGNALVTGIGFECVLCRGGAQCHPCDLMVEKDDENAKDALNCRAGEQDEESFPLNTLEPWLGGRCCLFQ